MKCAAIVLFLSAGVALGAVPKLQILQKPALSKTQVVFSYAGDLWTVPRSGGAAIRLTSGIGVETEPAFSPDGNWVAFSGEYDGNVDVFLVASTGGNPKRLTYHPDADRVVGWTPDGRNIIFRSGRDSFSRYTKLFTVSPEGGPPVALPLPMAHAGAYSPDARHLVYAPVDGGQRANPFNSYVAWKRYRGGLASFLWVADMTNFTTVKIPRDASNDYDPMWIGEQIYFLSDRNGPATLFRYDPAKKTISEVLKNSGYDIKSASAGPGGIVYEQFGSIFIYDVASAKANKLDIQINGDMQEVRPYFKDASKDIQKAGISATGARALFEAHGEIFTVPAEKGNVRNLTNTPGVMERDPVWSPDGQKIAYFSDESGEYALHLSPQSGNGEVKKIALAGGSSYYFNPVWSPDNKMIAFRDNKLNLWSVELATGKMTKIAADEVYEILGDIDWSPDSKWIAYGNSLGNRLHAVYLYSLDSGKSTQVTDGMSDARFPVFDKDGQYLYFAASTNYGATSSGLDMNSDLHDVVRSVYAAVLPNDIASPVAPQSDEEKADAKDAAKDSAKDVSKDAPKDSAKDASKDAVKEVKPPKPTRVDLDNIGGRIVSLPIPARDYFGLLTGKPGVIYVVEGPSRGRFATGSIIQKFDLKTRKLEKVAEDVRAFDLSANGEKMMIQTGAPGQPQFAIVPAAALAKPGEGVLKMAGMDVKVDPLAEWKQMYHEVWRIERSYFYDPNFHGVDPVAAEKRYEPYLDSLTSRADLNYIFQEMLGEFTVGHLRGGGGTMPTPKAVPGGLLGADYEIANGRYRFKKIYSGESWNPDLRAPLVQPGVKVNAGDYLLAVNGENLTATDDVSRLLEGTSGKSVVLKVGADPSGANSREITVTPVPNERPLRNLAWIEENRRTVDRLSGGKLAYVYMPDTGAGGFTSFNRYFYAQTDKRGLVLDERYNGGGQAADYIIDVLRRPLLSYWVPRYGATYQTPAGSIQGPKVMIINEFAGSGGDAMPYYFHETKIGTLVGKRTWGGLVGISQYPTLMDGGFVTSPNFAFFSPTGSWDVENHGVSPDVEVELDPKNVHEGHDPQLERAVSIAISQLEKNPPPSPKRPAFPDYHRSTQNARPDIEKTGQ